jgi:hypothetical protein
LRVQRYSLLGETARASAITSASSARVPQNGITTRVSNGIPDGKLRGRGVVVPGGPVAGEEKQFAAGKINR